MERSSSRTAPRGRGRAAIDIWAKLYQEWHDRLVRVAKTAIDAGVEERQVRPAEQQAEQLAAVIRAILSDLGNDLEDDRVRKVEALPGVARPARAGGKDGDRRRRRRTPGPAGRAAAEPLAAVIRAIRSDLGHDLEDDRVRKVVRLRLLEGGAGEASSPPLIEPSAEAGWDGDEDVPEDAS